MGKKLYVGNLPPSLSAEDLRQLFAKSGAVANIKIGVDHRGRSQGFAFVEMDSADAAALAIKNLNGYDCSGLDLTVNIAKSTPARDIRKTLAKQRNRGKSK